MSKLQDKSFDLIVFPYSLHHHNQPDQALRGAYRVLKSGGEIAIIEPQHQGEYCQFLFPVHNEEKKLAVTKQAIVAFSLCEKRTREYLVNWSFDNRADIQKMISNNYHPPVWKTTKMLGPLPRQGRIVFKDSVVLWVLKKK